MMNITERLQYIVDEVFEGNKAAFARALDIAPTSIANYLNKERASKPSSDILEKIANTVANLNLHWLLTGKGEAFQTDTQYSIPNIEHIESDSKYIECIHHLTKANLLNAEANNRNSQNLEKLIQILESKN
ncbi:hypothetical protein [uncultured Bacteroides sp.]|jgi:transcriptional regulator with XRE-family HTH domain|uniref:hypothetical protein n=1 Tax=uncultured Bacteroides sp. TaxID=162156 RepID=UPI0025F2D6E9|nr:hypothetical protein [uncultured Bacteroides sp.]